MPQHLALAIANELLSNDEKMLCCWVNFTVAICSRLDLTNNWVFREDFLALASAKQLLSNDEKIFGCVVSGTVGINSRPDLTNHWDLRDYIQPPART